MKKRELEQLRKEIVLNSLYLSDYENSLNIPKEIVCNFFEGYFEELCYITEEEIGEEEYKKLNGDKFYNEIFKRDNIDNLYNYYLSIENVEF